MVPIVKGQYPPPTHPPSLWLEHSLGGLGTCPPRIRGDCCIGWTEGHHEHHLCVTLCYSNHFELLAVSLWKVMILDMIDMILDII